MDPEDEDPTLVEEPAVEPADDPEGEDPLADFDDATRERLSAYVSAQTKAQVDEETKRLRAGYGRFGRAQQLSGISVDEHGNPVLADPAKFREFAQQYAPLLGTAPVEPTAAAEDELGPMPDPTYYPDDYLRWLDKRDDLRDRKKFGAYEQKIADLQARILGVQAAPAIDGVRECLVDLNAAHLADSSEFRQRLQQSIVEAGYDPTNEAGVEMLAGALVAVMRREAKLKGQPFAPPAPAPDPAQRAQVQRAALAQTAPSRGAGTPPRAQYTQSEQEIAAATGQTLEEVRALMAPPDLRTGNSPYYDYRQKARHGRR